jgi:glycosyltransferase involved in cell wall biosynthesis
MEIHQLVHTLNYGDAISNEALTIQRLLAKRNIVGNIYSINAHEKVKQYTIPYAECPSAFSTEQDAVVVLHYSIGSPLNDLFREMTNVRKAIVYHNLTPADWFSRYNPRVRVDLEQGLEELPPLCEISDIVLADSEFNNQELKEFGCQKGKVLPLVLDTEKWSIASNVGIRQALSGHGGKNVLHVGRLAPNKRIEDIIKAFYFYHHKIERKSKLWLVGIDIDTEVYSFELRRLVHELRLHEAVEFVGAVHDSELRAFYEGSDLYMCMSEHEGFCVPLLEAMHFELPIIAFDSCAVAETLGNAGMLLARKDPSLVAELMDEVLTSTELKQELLANSRARVAAFGIPAFEKTLFEYVGTGRAG